MAADLGSMSRNGGFVRHCVNDLGREDPGLQDMRVCVCVCVCVCVSVCVRANPVFQGPVYRTFLYCEVILYSGVLLPGSFSKPPLSGGIASRSPSQNFG